MWKYSSSCVSRKGRICKIIKRIYNKVQEIFLIKILIVIDIFLANNEAKSEFTNKLCNYCFKKSVQQSLTSLLAFLTGIISKSISVNRHQLYLNNLKSLRKLSVKSVVIMVS